MCQPVRFLQKIDKPWNWEFGNFCKEACWMVRECEEISERLRENAKKTTQESCDLSFFKTWSFLGMCFHVPLRRSREVSLLYSLVLTVAIQLSFICLYGKTGFCHCPCDCTEWTRENFAQVTFIAPQVIYRLRLWMKLGETLACLSCWLHSHKFHHLQSGDSGYRERANYGH